MVIWVWHELAQATVSSGVPERVAERQLGRAVEADRREHTVERGANRRGPIVLIGGGDRPYRGQPDTAEERRARRAGIEEHRVGRPPCGEPIVTRDHPDGV